MTFGEVLAELETLIDFKSNRTEGRVRHFMVLALRDLSRNRLSWNTGNTTFTLTVGQKTYSFGGASGLPVNVYRILDLYDTSSGVPKENPLDVLSVAECRASRKTGTPAGYSQFARSIIFDASPTVANVIWIDYLYDGRYDDSGSLISATASDNSTNEWLTHGVPEIEQYVLEKYARTVAHDREAADDHALTLANLLEGGADEQGGAVDNFTPGFYLQ